MATPQRMELAPNRCVLNICEFAYMPWMTGSRAALTANGGGPKQWERIGMTTKADFTPEDWKQVLGSVMMTGMAVTLADPSGLIGLSNCKRQRVTRRQV